MSFSLLRGKQFVAVALAVLLSTLVVALVAQGTTYVDTDSVGVASATPGTALDVKGAAIFQGFVSADYYTSTSTNSSWFFGNFGIGTTTPGARLSVRGGADIADALTVEDNLKTSYFTATSTTATSTLNSFGASLASTTITIDGASGRMAIGSTTVADADVGTYAVDPALTISGQGSAGNATGTLYLAGEGGKGGQLIIQNGSGLSSRCASITANTAALDIGASGSGTSDAGSILIVKVINCPR